MAKAISIRPDIAWVGVKHPELAVFDELFRTAHGSTYNAYLVKGREKVALIDTVKAPFREEYLSKVQSVISLEEIDLVVVNHTEPDHSGALGALLDRHPDLPIYCTRAAENFLKQLYERPLNIHVVSDGEEIYLGGKTLRFLLAPFLHWPDTMFTYLPEEEILFPCDAFGAHYCGEKLFDDEMEDFSTEFSFYFDSIMRPFKEKIREAVAKVENLSISLICPSHGPILRRDPMAAVKSYAEWSAPAGGDRPAALLLDLSPHGNTHQMGDAVAEGLKEKGVEVVRIGLYGANPAEIRDALEKCDALVIGSPTINRDAPPPVWNALSLLSTVTPRGKVGAVFGSFGWSGEAAGIVSERLKGLKYTLPLPPLTFRFHPTPENIEACRDFGRRLAETLAQG